MTALKFLARCLWQPAVVVVFVGFIVLAANRYIPPIWFFGTCAAVGLVGTSYSYARDAGWFK